MGEDLVQQAGGSSVLRMARAERQEAGAYFRKTGVTWESIHEVEKTSPGAWRWTVGPTAADELADTES